MLEFETEDATFTFDGTVVEHFDRGGRDNRFHARYIKYVALKAGRKGRQIFELRTLGGGGLTTLPVKEDHLGRAEEFVNAVTQAAATLQAGG